MSEEKPPPPAELEPLSDTSIEFFLAIASTLRPDVRQRIGEGLITGLPLLERTESYLHLMRHEQQRSGL